VSVTYEQGLHEIGDGLFAYLQPDGGYGWSNAGLIAGDGTSLLVDTLEVLARRFIGRPTHVDARRC
jgi:hypothetical protein